MSKNDMAKSIANVLVNGAEIPTSSQCRAIEHSNTNNTPKHYHKYRDIYPFYRSTGKEGIFM